MISGVGGVNYATQSEQTGSEDSKSSTTGAKNALASKDTFLQLLVAQIRHQNPLQPTDGIQFLSQLAQFSGLEQTIAMREELEAIHAALDGSAAAQSEAAQA
jgi:flagellar basal-body rod modification protein FlgD